MKSIQKLLIPEKIELIFYPVLACFLLLVNNYKNIINYIKNKVGVISADNTNSLLSPVVETLNRWQHSINPRYFDILAWLIIGLFLVTVVMIIDFIIGNVSNERSLLGQIHSPNNRRTETRHFLTKVALSLSAIVGLLMFTVIFLSKILTIASYLFYSNVVEFDIPSSVAILLACILVISLSLYVFAILARLILLRPRVFK